MLCDVGFLQWRVPTPLPFLRVGWIGALRLSPPFPGDPNTFYKKVLWGVFRRLNTFSEGSWSPRV